MIQLNSDDERECKPSAYFSNPDLQVLRPPNPCTQIWSLGTTWRVADSYHSV